jgi:hypothetical protein
MAAEIAQNVSNRRSMNMSGKAREKINLEREVV